MGAGMPNMRHQMDKEQAEKVLSEFESTTAAIKGIETKIDRVQNYVRVAEDNRRNLAAQTDEATGLLDGMTTSMNVKSEEALEYLTGTIDTFADLMEILESTVVDLQLANAPKELQKELGPLLVPAVVLVLIITVSNCAFGFLLAGDPDLSEALSPESVFLSETDDKRQGLNVLSIFAIFHVCLLGACAFVLAMQFLRSQCKKHRKRARNRRKAKELLATQQQQQQQEEEQDEKEREIDLELVEGDEELRLSTGDHVAILRRGEEGRLGIVTNPDHNGDVVVESTDPDALGQIRPYSRSELEFADYVSPTNSAARIREARQPPSPLKQPPSPREEILPESSDTSSNTSSKLAALALASPASRAAGSTPSSTNSRNASTSVESISDTLVSHCASEGMKSFSSIGAPGAQHKAARGDRNLSKTPTRPMLSSGMASAMLRNLGERATDFREHRRAEPGNHPPVLERLQALSPLNLMSTSGRPAKEDATRAQPHERTPKKNYMRKENTGTPNSQRHGAVHDSCEDMIAEDETNATSPKSPHKQLRPRRGDRVRVIKESKVKGHWGVVVTSKRNELVVIELEDQHLKDRIRAYRPSELALAAAQDQWI